MTASGSELVATAASGQVPVVVAATGIAVLYAAQAAP
jgi:hypothetical protein